MGTERREEHFQTLSRLRARAEEQLLREVPGLKVITDGGAPHILPVTMPGYKSEVVVRYLGDRGVYLSSGSACHRGRPSHVFAALKLPKAELDGVLRISFSPDNTDEDLDALVQGLAGARRELFSTLS